MKCRTVLCIGMLAVSLPAQQPPPLKGLNLYTPEREIRLGREAAYNLEHTLPLVRVSRLDEYLAKVATAFSEQAGYSLPFRFTVFDDRKPFTAYPGELAMPVDAFGSKEPVALPGGFIFVPLSLLAGARDETELAFQLAHAMAHVTRRHGSRRATREQLAGMVSVDVSVRAASVQLDISGGRNSPAGYWACDMPGAWKWRPIEAPLRCSAPTRDHPENLRRLKPWPPPFSPYRRFNSTSMPPMIVRPGIATPRIS